jgi:hypothetical protein
MPHRSQVVARRVRKQEDTAMTSLSYPIRTPAPLPRSLAIAALLGATMLTSSMTAARAADATFQLAQAPAPQSQAGTGATTSKGETVEQRITSLHAALKITPDEDAKWNDVAQAMRENAAAMDKLVAESRTTPPQSMTAMQDLQMYQKIAQAHVDGLKNLIASFTALYSAMPDAQKKVADGVFRAAHQTGSARS